MTPNAFGIKTIKICVIYVICGCFYFSVLVSLWLKYMRYEGMIIRPPSEADSYLLQITYGCSHNKCTFCGTYLGTKFRVRKLDEVLEDISMAQRFIPHTRRVFLCDGDAMLLPTDYLLKILKALTMIFPDLQRVGIYANASDILKKSDSELSELSRHKLTIAYLGLESGNDEILKKVKKGATAKDMIDAVRKAQDVGIKMSVIGLIGLGGRELSTQHAIDTAKVVNKMTPRYFSLLTLMIVPGTPLADDYKKGRLELPDPEEMVKEVRMVVENMDSPGTIFRANHASNYAPLAGTFNKDKERLLQEIDRYLNGKNEFRPEFLRGL
ncbi:MAG: radical SAM protein [Planctomycetota bacterium]|nr:radical SAM protein [Planctomycetota bacterium]